MLLLLLPLLRGHGVVTTTYALDLPTEVQVEVNLNATMPREEDAAAGVGGGEAPAAAAAAPGAAAASLSAADAPAHPQPAQSEPREDKDQEGLPTERSFVFESRVEAAGRWRERGTELFRGGEVDAAVEAYERALYHVDFDELQYNFELLDEHRAVVDAVRVPVLVNVATCHFRLNRFPEALAKLEDALKYDAKNVKALYRRAQIRREMGDLERAMADLTAAIKLEPGNAEVAKALGEVRRVDEEKRREADEVMRSRYKGKLDPSPPPSAASTTPSTPLTLTASLTRRCRDPCNACLRAMKEFFGGLFRGILASRGHPVPRMPPRAAAPKQKQ